MRKITSIIMRSLHLAFYKSIGLTSPPLFEHNDFYDILIRNMEYTNYHNPNPKKYAKQSSMQYSTQ